MKFLNLFENFNRPNYNLSDIEDVFRDLDEENDSIIVEHIPEPILGIFKEFLVCKPNKDGRQFISTLGGRRINLEKFDINIVLEYIKKSVSICENDDIPYRIFLSDGQFVLDISKIVNKISTMSDKELKKYVVHKTHLNTNKSDDIDLLKINYLIFQITY